MIFVRGFGHLSAPMIQALLDEFFVVPVPGIEKRGPLKLLRQVFLGNKDDLELTSSLFCAKNSAYPTDIGTLQHVQQPPDRLHVPYDRATNTTSA